MAETAIEPDGALRELRLGLGVRVSGDSWALPRAEWGSGSYALGVPRATGRSARRAQAIVGVLVGLALLLQLALAPLHLARHDHLAPLHAHAGLDDGHHVHGHGHDHDRRPSGEPEPERDPGHAPHPAADHFDLFGEPATPPSGGQLDLALAPQAVAVWIRSVPESAALDEPESCPRPPPPRDAASPRAPPVAT